MEHSELSYTELSSVAGAARGAEEGLNWPESLDNESIAFRSAGLRGTWPWKDIHCVLAWRRVSGYPDCRDQTVKPLTWTKL